MIQASFLVVHWDFFLQGCYTAQKFSLQFYTSCSITSSSYLAGKWHRGLFKKTKMTSIVCIDECTVQNNGLVSSVVQSDYVTLLKKVDGGHDDRHTCSHGRQRVSATYLPHMHAIVEYTLWGKKRNQLSFVCVFLNTWEKLLIFFTYIKESIRYNSVYLILACVENVAATVTWNILYFAIK